MDCVFPIFYTGQWGVYITFICKSQRYCKYKLLQKFLQNLSDLLDFMRGEISHTIHFKPHCKEKEAFQAEWNCKEEPTFNILFFSLASISSFKAILQPPMSVCLSVTLSVSLTLFVMIISKWKWDIIRDAQQKEVHEGFS